MTVRDNVETPLVQFQSDGNVLVIKGALSTMQTGMSSDPNVPEFIVKNNAGDVLLRVDGSTGNLSVRDYTFEDRGAFVSFGPPALIIRDSSAGMDTVFNPPQPRNAVRLSGEGTLFLGGEMIFPPGP